MRKTKIIATLGPASECAEKIQALIDAGANLFRLNFSHGNHESHARIYKTIRSLEKEVPIGVIADLQGPKLRVGKIDAFLQGGALFQLDLDPGPGDASRVCFPHAEIYSHLIPGTRLLLNDGRIRLRIEKNLGTLLQTRVEEGGGLSDHKGVNIPDIYLPVPALTEKDRKDLSFALDLGVDFIALSFVQKPEDVQAASALIQGRAKILSKIEKPLALESLEEIICLSDGVMVARGDLGVELPLEDVPRIQKHIITLSQKCGKPVVVATQMLESMISSSTPTRAEVSDVANAVYDGADAVMLSAESASGSYPIESVKMMQRIILKTEQDPHHFLRLTPEATLEGAITAAAQQVAETISAKAIVVFTATGRTALQAARQRPVPPIFCLTENPLTARFLTLVWGITPYIFHEYLHHAMAADFCIKKGYAKSGEKLVITGGDPLGEAGSTSFLYVQTL